MDCPLSAVLEKLLRRLCLSDFPCGHGSWCKTGGSKSGEPSRGEEDREGTDALLDLLGCPRSPWGQEGSWSPQASALRRLSVLASGRLHRDFIYKHFTTLRVTDKGVSAVDDGLLKFSNLEELVLNSNNISEIPTENFPRTLRVLELCANRLSGLDGLSGRSLPRLQHLGLGSNNLGSHEDIRQLTGTHWPALVSLDLSDCEFASQHALLTALSSLPCLRTLALQANPLTLAPSYPGFTVDSLPRLSHLDGSQISPEDRHRYRGMSKKSGVMSERAAATVSVCRMWGIPHPHTHGDENPPDFPVTNHSYYVTYEFLSYHMSAIKESEPRCATVVPSSSHGIEEDADLQSNLCDQDMVLVDAPAWVVNSEEDSVEITYANHSTSKVTWAECQNFSHVAAFFFDDLRGLKRFFRRGLFLRLVEEKVLSWPAAPEDAPSSKSSQREEKNGKRGKEPPSKAAPNKNKPKDGKKGKCVSELVHDAPIRRTLGSVHVPLQSLLKGDQKVDVLCDLGVLLTESPAKRVKDDKDKELKSRANSVTGQTNAAAAAASKGKGKGRKGSEVDARIDDVCGQLEPLTVEFRVQLEKWNSAAEAHRAPGPRQTSGRTEPEWVEE